MRVSCVRRAPSATSGKARDSFFVVRTDGTEVTWTFPSYGDGLPHDLVHLVVESACGIARGFWGLVDGGADPARVNAVANRTVGKLADKYAAFGDDSELVRAEALANGGWTAHERASEIRRTLDALQARWAALKPNEALVLAFPLAALDGDGC